MIVYPVLVLITMAAVAVTAGTDKGRATASSAFGWMGAAVASGLGWVVGLFTGRTSLPSLGGREGKGVGKGNGSPSSPKAGSPSPKGVGSGSAPRKGKGRGKGKPRGGKALPSLAKKAAGRIARAIKSRLTRRPPKGKASPIGGGPGGGQTPPPIVMTSTTKVTRTTTRTVPRPRATDDTGTPPPSKGPGMSSPANYTPREPEPTGGGATSTQAPTGGAGTDPRAHTAYGLTLPSAGEDALNGLRAALEQVDDYCATVMRHTEGASGFLRGALQDLHEKASTEAQAIAGEGGDLLTEMTQLVESVREAATSEATAMQQTYETADASAGFLAPVPTVGQLREG